MKLIMESPLYTISVTTLICVISIVGYYINEVRIARRDTAEFISIAETRYGAELNVSDLSYERETMLFAIEDPTFRRHHGVDLYTPGAGMTTITQGLVKLLYFPEGFRPGIAKIRQTLIAQYALDSLVSKNEQLNLFLNISYFGNENGKAVYGFENAAQTYYGKNFTSLTDDEFLTLVAMLISPNKLKPHTKASLERLNRIKKYLAGDYQPAGVLDFDYNGRRNGSFAEQGLMMFLRFVTNARPSR